jgi:hypothetical protein
MKSMIFALQLVLLIGLLIGGWMYMDEENRVRVVAYFMSMLMIAGIYNN